MNRLFALAVLLICFSDVGFAAGKRKAKAPAPRKSSPPPAPLSIGGGSTNVENPLRVKGQARNLSMMLVLKNRDDQIKFIKVRRDFREEILSTPF